MEKEFPQRLQALLTVALILDGEEAMEVFDFLPAAEKEVMVVKAKSYIALPENDRRTALASRLRALRSEFLLRQITEIHPSHIALVLANEPPPITRLIFHNLPTEMVGEIEKFLPERTLKSLAAYPDTPTVAAELVEVIKHAFIRQFIFILPGDNPITLLNMARLASLVREMSFQTISIAMRRIDRQELVTSLQRFPRNYSKEIVRRIKLLRDIEPEQVFAAERVLVWLNAQNLRNFNIVEDTGLMLLAGGMIDANETLQKFVAQKLSLEESARFFDLIARLRQAEPEILSFCRSQMSTTLKTLLQLRRPPLPASGPASTQMLPNRKESD